MAKRVCSLFIKLILFILIMLIVAKTVHYEELVSNFVSNHVSSDSSEKFAKFILGEPDPEPRESIRTYIGIFINILLSVPLLSALIFVFNTAIRKVKYDDFLKEWTLATFRRFTKIFLFIFLFWAFFRLLPYQAVFPDNQNYSSFTTLVVLGFNLALTITCYWFITKIITTQRSL